VFVVIATTAVELFLCVTHKQRNAVPLLRSTQTPNLSLRPRKSSELQRPAYFDNAFYVEDSKVYYFQEELN
jgi:hypothetical protein